MWSHESCTSTGQLIFEPGFIGNPTTWPWQLSTNGAKPSQKAICVWTLFLAAVWKVVLWGILLLSIYIPSVKSLCLKQSRRCTFVRRLCLWIACTHIVGMSLVVLLHLQIEFFFTWSKTDIVHTLRKNTGNGWDSSQAVKRLQWGIFNVTSGKHKHIITHTEYSSHSSIR